VRVLSRLFRRLFLEKLQAAFAAGELRFCGALARLVEAPAFAQWSGRIATGRVGRL
jgi:hypothetical protein